MSIHPPARSRRGLKFWIGRILLGLLFLMISLGIIGAIYQAIGVNRDRRNFPPPGQLVDVGGYQLHIYCTGAENTGNPTVILETLSGGLSPYWAWVQPEVAKVTRVCSYDRAGRAWSEPSPQPQDLPQTVDALHTLLAKASIAPPYVLVGHSIGGLYVRQFAADHPAEVVGMVLVDAAHPEQFDRHPEMWAQTENFMPILASFPFLARIGLFRFYFASGGEIDFQDLPSRQHDEVAAAWSTPKYFNSQRAELMSAAEIYRQAHELGSLDELPLAVISAGTNQPAGWAALQAELAKLSSNQIHQTIEEASHASLAFNPQHAQVVSTAILQVVDAARTGQPLQ